MRKAAAKNSENFASFRNTRRTVVSTANCNQCHAALQAHGTRRNAVEYCALCHNPSTTDASTCATSKTASDKSQPAQTVNFAIMAHRIHDGVNVTANGGKPYIVVGHGGRHVDSPACCSRP